DRNVTGVQTCALPISAQRYRDHDPLPRSAGELVWIETEDRLRIVDSDEPEVLEDLTQELLFVLLERQPHLPFSERWDQRFRQDLRGLGEVAFRVVVRCERRDESLLLPGFSKVSDVDRFGNLVFNSVRGIQGVDRLLKDHADPRPSNLRKLPLR